MVDERFIPAIGWTGTLATLTLSHINELVAVCIGVVTLGYMVEKFRMQRRRRRAEENEPFPPTKNQSQNSNDDSDS
jgi:hypothetical protein